MIKYGRALKKARKASKHVIYVSSHDAEKYDCRYRNGH